MPTHTTGRDLPLVSVDANTVYLNAAQVRSRYGGMSDMALWRWLHDDELGFPQPLRINGRRFWMASALSAWERAHAEVAEGCGPAASAQEPADLQGGDAR